MVSKDRLLNMFDGELELEEKLIEKAGVFLMQEIEASEMGDAQKEEAKHLLNRLAEDSKRHKTMVQNLKVRVESDGKGEW